MTTTNTPAPDAGHAAETMSNEDVLFWMVSVYGEQSLAEKPERRNALADQFRRYHAEALRRMNHTAPARTAGTETGGTE